MGLICFPIRVSGFFFFLEWFSNVGCDFDDLRSHLFWVLWGRDHC